jgi:hypothetical protein
MRSELKLVEATSIYQYLCYIAWISQALHWSTVTGSNVLQVRIASENRLVSILFGCTGKTERNEEKNIEATCTR